jgi:hypothetical protein
MSLNVKAFEVWALTRALCLIRFLAWLKVSRCTACAFLAVPTASFVSVRFRISVAVSSFTATTGVLARQLNTVEPLERLER